MGRKRIIAFAVILCLIITASVFAGQISNPNISDAKQLGSQLKDSIQNLLNTSSENEQKISSEKVVAEIGDEEISKEYFEYKVTVEKVLGSDDPNTEALKKIGNEVALKKFAEEHNIMPTEEQIQEFLDSQKRTFATDPEANEWLQTVISSMGLTEDQYWNEFAPKYHALILGIKYNVSRYCKENNLPEITASDIKCNILNAELKAEMAEESQK